MKRVLGLLAIGLLLIGRVWAAEEKRELSWSFPAQDAPSISLSVKVGEIKVEADKRDKIEIKATRIVRAKDRDEARRLLDATSVKVELRDRRVTLDDQAPRELSRGHRDGDKDAPQVELRLEVRIPAGMSLRTNLDAGETRISGDIGVLAVRTGAGNVKLERQKLRKSGAVSIEAGDLSIDGAVCDFNAILRNGSIQADKLDAGDAESLTFQTQVGNIQISLRTAPHDELKAMAGNGRVQVKVPGGTRADAYVSAANGTVKSDFPLRARSSRSVGNVGGQLSGQIGNGSSGLSIRVQSGVGDASLEKN